MMARPKILSIVLAGSEGKRLMSLTSGRAEPAVPFGGSYRLIDSVLSDLMDSGLTQIAVLARYKSHSPDRHVSMMWRFLTLIGVYVTPIPAQQCLGPRWHQGSAGAIYRSLNPIRNANPDCTVVFGADNVYRMDVRQMVDVHIDSSLDCIVAGIRVPRSKADAFGIIDAGEDKHIRSFLEKPTEPPELPDSPEESFASMGNYIFSRHALMKAFGADTENPTAKHDMGDDIVPWFTAQGQSQVYDFRDNVVPGATERDLNYWRGVDTIDAYHKAHMDPVSVEPGFNLYNSDWPLLTSQSQAPGAKFVVRGKAGDSIVNPGCIISGGEADRTMFGPNVCIDKWSQVSDSMLMDGANVGRDAVVRRAVLDKHVIVTDGAQVGVDHDHDRERGFHASPNGMVVIGKDAVVPRD